MRLRSRIWALVQLMLKAWLLMGRMLCRTKGIPDKALINCLYCSSNSSADKCATSLMPAIRKTDEGLNSFTCSVLFISPFRLSPLRPRLHTVLSGNTEAKSIFFRRVFNFIYGNRASPHPLNINWYDPINIHKSRAHLILSKHPKPSRHIILQN